MNDENYDNMCIICQEQFTEENPKCTLECKHSFHSGCIIKWFRMGNKNCPLCNHTGNNTQFNSYFHKVVSLREIHNLGKRKDCPDKIKKLLCKLKKMKEHENKLKLDIKKFLTDNKQQIVKYKNLKNKKWEYVRKINQFERALVTLLEIKPIYIVDKKKHK